MADSPLYLGIDLGTTNSTAAVYDGERLEVVRNAQGSPLTPSVVRIDARGVVTVGARARKMLESDPVGTRAEFKRLMGTSTPIEISAAKLRRMPEELAAEVLKALRTDVQAQTGVLPETAIISVPALFELPQSRATSDAARLAGFEKVELIQEPIASALAAGWSADLGEGRWLVYDMGGGTFDVSLLETRDGFLRVVDHDGDNYLGGRDIDWAIVDWILAELAASGSVSIARSDPTASVALRKLKVAAEEAKIEAARGAEASIFVAGLIDGVDVDLVLDPARLERLCLPLVDRSIEVCRRLLERHAVDSTSLSRVVLVGGPTTMPSLRALVQAALGAPFAKAIDPMTVVAQGAALFAATAGLDARPKAKSRAPAGRTLVLRFPPVAPDLETHVVGRVADLAASPLLDTLRLVPSGGGEPSVGSIEPDGTFAIAVTLLARRPNVFRIEAESKGAAITVTPDTITIVQGVTVGDPPLSRSIGVALATNRVSVYFERGTALPARAVFTHRTYQTLSSASDSTLRIPIVQGEFTRADLCRLVGAIEIRGADLSRSLPAGSDIEITLELDRGGRLSAKAFVLALDRMFEDVAKLLVPDVPAEALAASLEALDRRLRELQPVAFRKQIPALVKRLVLVDTALAYVTRDVEAATGGDEDAAQRARRALLDAEASLDDVDLHVRFDVLSENALDELASAAHWIASFGTPMEQSLFQEIARSAALAREKRQVPELERSLERVRDLRVAAYLRAPDSWSREFDHAASRLERATDLAKAQRIVSEGKAARKAGDRVGVERATRALWDLLPPRDVDKRLSYDSGLQ